MQVSDAMSYLAYLAFVGPYPAILEASLRRYGRLLLRSQPLSCADFAREITNPCWLLELALQQLLRVGVLFYFQSLYSSPLVFFH